MFKALLLLAHLLYGIALTAYVACGGPVPAERLAQAWSRRLLRILEVRLRVEGRPLAGAHMTVANHVSWLDIPALAVLEPTRFVAKSEVRDWPLAGWFANAAGTFFIRRGKGGAAPLLERLVPHLRRGGAVVVFPEGTTTDGTAVRPFHPRLFQGALDARCPVQPVTLQYGLAPDGANVAPFIGEDTLAAHVLRMLRAGPLELRVSYGPPLPPEGSRDDLAQEAEACVRGALQPIACPWPAGPAPALGWSRA